MGVLQYVQVIATRLADAERDHRRRIRILRILEVSKKSRIMKTQTNFKINFSEH